MMRDRGDFKLVRERRLDADDGGCKLNLIIYFALLNLPNVGKNDKDKKSNILVLMTL